MRACFALALAILSLAPVYGQERDAKEMVIVRPVEIDDVLVNPGMGIQTFQRFNGEAIYPTLDWSEAGPVERGAPVKTRPDFPASSVAYLRWFWSQIQPEPGQFRWDIIDTALDEARRHGQTLAMRLMQYDDRNPMPEWYRNSGAKRGNAASDKDGAIWSPDASDPRYIQQWSALVKAVGARYDGHPYLDSVDVSTVGYWGEGWGPYLPDWPTQKALLDVYFEVFRRTPLLMNFGSLPALAYGGQRGAGWRLDCWGDLGGMVEEGFSHMLDRYPQWVVQGGIEDAWKHAPVSLETCGTPGHWKQRGYTERELKTIFDQALRWHASTVNIKSTAIPNEWKPAFDAFQKKLGYRFVLRRLEYPRTVRAGQMAPVRMWWLNAGVAPVYRPYTLAVELRSRTGGAVIPTPADVAKWLPGDAVFDSTVYIPESLSPGDYRMRVALLDSRTERPAIRLAIAGRQDDGWYDLGDIRVE